MSARERVVDTAQALKYGDGSYGELRDALDAYREAILAARDAETVEGQWRASEGNPGTGWWLEKFDGYWRSYIGALDERTAKAYASALNRADRYLEAK